MTESETINTKTLTEQHHNYSMRTTENEENKTLQKRMNHPPEEESRGESDYIYYVHNGHISFFFSDVPQKISNGLMLMVIM